MQASPQPSRSPRATGAVLAALWLAISLPTVASERSLEIVYLANEGFLLRSGETAVLIDAVFGDGLFGYDVLPAEERRRLEAARPPYEDIDLALASHVHGDHLNVVSMARFLAASPETLFLSTEDAARKLRAHDSRAEERVRGLLPAEGRSTQLEFGDVRLTIYNLHHGRGRPAIQNLGLLIELCGLTVLHVGDTEASAAEMRTAGLQDLAPDVALLPSWYLRPGRWLEATTEVIRPRRAVAMHLPTDEAPSTYFWGGLDSRVALADAIRKGFPQAFVPLRTGASIELACR